MNDTKTLMDWHTKLLEEFPAMRKEISQLREEFVSLREFIIDSSVRSGFHKKGSTKNRYEDPRTSSERNTLDLALLQYFRVNAPVDLSQGDLAKQLKRKNQDVGRRRKVLYERKYISYTRKDEKRGYVITRAGKKRLQDLIKLDQELAETFDESLTDLENQGMTIGAASNDVKESADVATLDRNIFEEHADMIEEHLVKYYSDEAVPIEKLHTEIGLEFLSHVTLAVVKGNNPNLLYNEEDGTIELKKDAFKDGNV